MACILEKASKQTNKNYFAIQKTLHDTFCEQLFKSWTQSNPYHLYITDASLPTPSRSEKRIRRHFKSALNRSASWQRARKKQKQMMLWLTCLYSSVLPCANIKGPLTLGTVIVRCYIQSLWYVLNISELQRPIFQRRGRNCCCKEIGHFIYRASSLKLVQRKEALCRERSKPLSNEQRDTCVKFKWAG